jgi:hypothetical protein
MRKINLNKYKKVTVRERAELEIMLENFIIEKRPKLNTHNQKYVVYVTIHELLYLFIGDPVIDPNVKKC